MTFFKDHPKTIFSMNLSDLLDKESLKSFIEFYGTKLKATVPDVVATYFSNYYGYVISGFLYTMAYNQQVFNLSLSNMEVQIYYDEQYKVYQLGFKIKDSTPLSCKENDRETWRNKQLENLFKENVTPVINTFTEVTNVRLRDLWGQMTVSLYYGHETNLKLANNNEEKEKVKADFKFVTKTLDGSIFNMKKNPFNIQFRMVESAMDPNVYLRMKPSCCLYYLTEGAENKCFTCPRMSEKEREERRKQLRMKNNQ